ncbi:helix-turn-helix transcriptional regulator [Brevibacterium casei]|nr:helix-turn-helix transcriptional regulator [Brevibacterium casei]
MHGAACDAEPVEERLAALATTSENRRLLAELNALQGRRLLCGWGTPLRPCAICGDATNSPRTRSIPTSAATKPTSSRPSSRSDAESTRHSSSSNRASGSNAVPRGGRNSPCAGARPSSPPGTRAMSSSTSRRGRGAPRTPSTRRRSPTPPSAGACKRLGSDSRAREQFLAAEAILTELGVEGSAQSPGPPAPAPSEPPVHPRLAELSEEELKVVELVRAGLKNKDIAGRVFVSLRTVELRLTAAYRKLGVGSRTELVSLLAGNPRLAAV